MITVLAAVAMSVFAGGNRETSTLTATSGDNRFVGQTLTMMLPTIDGEYDAILAQIAAFEAAYGVKVEVESIPSGDAGENLRRVRIATNALPDILTSSVGAKLVELNPSKNLMDLSGQGFLDRLDDGYRGIVTIDDGIYGVPITPSNVAGIFYNRKVYDALGLEIPLTWSDFLANCAKIKAAGKIPVMAPNSKTSLSQVPFLMNYFYVQHEDPDFARKYTNNQIKLSDSTAFVSGLQKMYDLAEKKYLNDDFLATTIEDVARSLAMGDAAHAIIRSNILSTIRVIAPEKLDDIRFFPLPDTNPEVRGVATWMPQAFLVSKNAKNPQLALLFMDFITSPAAIDVYCAYQAPTGAFMLKGIDLPDDVPVALKEAQKWVETSSSPVMEYYSPIKGPNQGSIASQVAAGMITPEQGVREIENDNTISARQLGLPNW